MRNWEKIFSNEDYTIGIDWDWDVIELCDTDIYDEHENSIEIEFEDLDQFINILQQIQKQIKEKKEVKE